jgi:DNA-binding NarL/FixJ family response regulator
MKMEPITVMLADDHTLFREGLAGLLSEVRDLQVVAQARDAHEAIELAIRHRPHIVLMDVRMPGGGVQATQEILRRCPETRVIMLTVSDQDEDLWGAIAAGASGYLLKDATLEEVIAAIRHVAAGKAILDPSLTPRVLAYLAEHPPPPAPLPPILSPREQEILKLIARGLSNKEIAAYLNLSIPTVKLYTRRLCRKLGVRNRAELRLQARRFGL